ncbi:uncharacterized protein C2orf16 homolog [Vombatus ursinus]|uniref:uncharacterized protein C2orf16 homolog n=1 Tax=Vombatus ursinus TaxID=29139 RepID=UPI000FFD1AEC|nr:uncharacterized protein C2orf16 homolog [Vombatus ursinus]
MELILGPGPPLPPPFSLLLLLGLLVIGVWSLLPGDRRWELLSAKISETSRQQKVPGNQKLTKVPPPRWEDNLQMGCTGADLACFSGLPVGWAQNYTLWSMDRSLQHIFQCLDIARSSLMNLSSSSQVTSTSSSSSSIAGPEDVQTLTCYDCHSPGFSGVQRTSSLHTNLSATQSLAYIFRENLQHQSHSLPNPSKNYSGQARVLSLPPFLLPQAKKDTTGKNTFLENCTCNFIQRVYENKASEEENDSWVPKEIRNSLEIHIRRKIAQRLIRPPIFRTIKLSVSPYPLAYTPIRKRKTTKNREGNRVLKDSNPPPPTDLRERPQLPCWAPIQLSHSARWVLEGHMAWKVCTLRAQRVPTAVKQSWAMLNHIIKVQNEGHKSQNTVKDTNKKSPYVSCCLLSMDLETDHTRPTSPKSSKADSQLQPRPPFITQNAFSSGVDVILGEVTFLQEDVKKKLELCIKKKVNGLLKKVIGQQKEAPKKNEELSTGVGTMRLLQTVGSVPLGPTTQVQVKDSKGLTLESHGQITDSLGLNSGPQVQKAQIQDTDKIELTPVPQKQDVDSLELKSSSSKVQDMDYVATTLAPVNYNADFVELTRGSPVQDMDSMGPTPGPQIKNVDSGGLIPGSQVKLTDSKGLAQGSQVKLTDSKGLAQGSQVKLTDSKGLGLIPGSQVKLTDSKGLIPGSQVKLTDSKGLIPESQVKLTGSKGLIPESQVKLTDSKGLIPGSQVKLTDSKGLIPGSRVKLTDPKGLIPESRVKLTGSKGLAQGSQVKLTDSKGLIPESQVKLTDYKGLIPGSQVKLTGSKGLIPESQVKLTDSKGLAKGSQVKLIDSKGLIPESQVKLTDSKGLAKGSQVKLTDSKGLAKGSQVKLIDSKGLIPDSQVKLTGSKGLIPGSQIKLTDSKGLVQGPQVKLTDSKGLIPGSQVKLTGSKGLIPGSQIKLTDSKGLVQGPQVKLTDSKGLISGSQVKLTDSQGLIPESQVKLTDSKGLAQRSQVKLTDSQGLIPESQVKLTDSKGLAKGSQIKLRDSKGPIPESQVKLTDSKGLAKGSQVKLTDSKGLIPGSQVKFTDSTGLAQRPQVKLTDSKGLAQGSQVKLTDSKGLMPGPQVKLTDSKGLAQGSQVKLTDSKGLIPESEVKLTDSKGLAQGSQVKLTDSKGLAQGSQIKLTVSKGLIPGSQVKLTDSKGLNPESQVKFTDSKGLAQRPQVKLKDSKGLNPGSQIKLTDSKGVNPGSQVKVKDSKGLAQGSQNKFKDSKGLTLNPHVQVIDSLELTPRPQTEVVESVELTSRPKFQVIDPKQPPPELQSPTGESFHVTQGSTPLYILDSSRIAAKLKQGDLHENIVILKPFILRMCSKFSKTAQPSTLPRPLSVQPSHSLQQWKLSLQCLFHAPLLPLRKSGNSFCQKGLRTPRVLKQPVSKRQVKAQEQQISKGRVAKRKSSSNTAMLRKNLGAKMRQAHHIQEAHVQRPLPIPYPDAPNGHVVLPRQTTVSQSYQGKIMGILCELCWKNLPFNEQLEDSRPSTSQDYSNLTTKEAQGSREPMEERKEREQVPSELSELPQNTSAQLPSSHKISSTEQKPVSVEQNEKPDTSSQIRTFESQPLTVTSSHEQTQQLQDLQLKITQQLLKNQLSPHFTPSQTTGMVLQYPICLQCGRCSGPSCPHKFHDSVGPWLVIYPQLHLFRNSEGHGEFRVHLGFRLRTRNQTQTPKQQREVGSLVSMKCASSQSDPSEKRKDEVCTCHVMKKNLTLNPCPNKDLGPEPFQNPERSENPEPIQVHIKRNLPGRRVEVAKTESGEPEQYDFTIHSLLDTDIEDGWASSEAKRIPDSEQVKTPKEIRTTTQKIERVPRQSTPKDRKIHPEGRTMEAQKIAPPSTPSEKSTGLMQWLCLSIKRALGMAYPPKPSFQQIHASRARPSRQQGSVFLEQSHVQHGSKNEGKQGVKPLNTTRLATKMERKPERDGKETEAFRPLNRAPKTPLSRAVMTFLK